MSDNYLTDEEQDIAARLVKAEQYSIHNKPWPSDFVKHVETDLAHLLAALTAARAALENQTLYRHEEERHRDYYTICSHFACCDARRALGRAS